MYSYIYLIIIFSILFILLSYSLISILAANKLLYHKKHKRISFTNLNIATEILQLEEVTISNSLRQTLYGWFKRNANSTLGDYVLLLQHGYKSNRSQMLQQAQTFYEVGFSILLTSVRAHDFSDGNVIHFGLSEVEDVHLWHNHLVEKEGFASKKIGLVGNSMGGAALLHANALYKDGAVLILQGVLSDMTGAIEGAIDHFTGLSGKLFGPGIARYIEYRTGLHRDMVRPYKWAEKVAIPTFILHGGTDRTLAADSGQRIFDHLKTPLEQKEIWFEPTQGHLEFELYYPEQFKKRVIDFLMKFFVKQDSSTPNNPQHP